MSDAPRPLSEAAQRVQDALHAGGFTNTVIELEVPVRTAAAAAEAVVAVAAPHLIAGGKQRGTTVAPGQAQFERLHPGLQGGAVALHLLLAQGIEKLTVAPALALSLRGDALPVGAHPRHPLRLSQTARLPLTASPSPPRPFAGRCCSGSSRARRVRMTSAG
mgnify:CR=1 FL=1